MPIADGRALIRLCLVLVSFLLQDIIFFLKIVELLPELPIHFLEVIQL